MIYSLLSTLLPDYQGTAIGQLVNLIPDVKLIGTASPAKHEKLKQYYSQLISNSQDYVAEVKKYV